MVTQCVIKYPFAGRTFCKTNDEQEAIYTENNSWPCLTEVNFKLAINNCKMVIPEK